MNTKLTMIYSQSKKLRLGAVLLLLTSLLSPVALRAGFSLDAGFHNPPPEARPWAYWYFMDGNMTREGLTADLESMKQAGIGGGIFLEVNVGIPRGPVEFMSPQWQELFQHAVREADRLGLRITLNVGPGWTGSGGPWIKPQQSMQHLVSSETNLAGPTRFDGLLPKPAPRKPFFGENTLTPALKKVRDEFYQDVVVLAFPTPAGSTRIADVDEKALYFRAPYSSQPGVRPFLPAPAQHPVIPSDQCIPLQGILDLTGKLSPDGRLRWEVPAGHWTVMRFGRRATAQTTRPAPEPGLGFECDKLDPTALDAQWSAFVQPLLRGLGPRPHRDSGWTTMHIDSWEMSSQNWTARFSAEFKKRRGYDPTPYLPAMAGRVVESLEVSDRFLWDLRVTAQELVVENHALHLGKLAHQNGLSLSIEPYDMNPAGDLNLGAAADVPMCEFWARGFGFNTDFSVFESVSIGHTLGRPVIAAEAFTSGDAERWLLYPGAMKAQGDWALAQGVNRFVFHRFQHQPWLDRWPGMTMGPYGVHWERTQTWWEMVGAYHAYLARCQVVLRYGQPVADILYLAPEGAPQVFCPPRSALQGDPPSRRGYNFDGCSPQVLLDRVAVKQGRLVLPEGTSYSALVLPRFDTMTPRLLRKLKDLTAAGARIIGTAPTKSPSLSGYPKCDLEVQRLAATLWGRPTTSLGKGVIPDLEAAREPPKFTGTPLAADIYPSYDTVARLLSDNGTPADFEADTFLHYTHRRGEKTDLYFVANPESRPVSTTAHFRVSGRQPELWDPLTGEQRDLPQWSTEAQRTSVPLHLEPHQSFFVVFRKPARAPSSPGQNFAEARPVLDLAGPWDVAFQLKRGAPERLSFDKLVDWSQHSLPGVRNFSGVATYTTRFDWTPASTPAAAHRRTFIDLGEVQVMASVKLNGRDLGVAWTTPFRVDATSALQPGANTLEIRVANLWPNRLIGDAALPADQRIAWTTWNPFPKETPLLPSGLMGPVRITSVE